MAKKKSAKKSKVKKAPVETAHIADTINTEVIAAALSTAPVLLKVCRLCEAKDGPFLNIFDADKVTAKKIEIVMPFKIVENDDLPHKICFRCSAKVEELYEFIQKCIRTQENLSKVVGNKVSGVKSKSLNREQWEEKLNQSNISNDDICDALIKKAMEGIRDIPLSTLTNTVLPIDEKTPVTKKTPKKATTVTKQEDQEEKSSDKNVNDTNDDDPIIKLKNEKLPEKDDQPPIKRSTRLSVEKKVEAKVEKKAEEKVEETEIKPTKSPGNKELKSNKKVKADAKPIEEPVTKEKGLKIKQSLQTNNFSLEEAPKTETQKSDTEAKAFDIMDHVSMIKVNGVGVLFQCNMCNRNFLKKEVVMTHACAKQGAAKVQGPKTFTPPEPPKVPQTVKYITMKVNKDVNKPVVSNDKCKTLPLEPKKPVTISETINLDNDDEDDKPLAQKKTKPKIGPASKVKRKETSPTTPVGTEPTLTGKSNQATVAATLGDVTLSTTPILTSGIQAPSVQFPTLPSLNSRYKLMPGPNNTFTLVEEKSTDGATKTQEPNANTIQPPLQTPQQPVKSTESNKVNAKNVSVPKSAASTGNSILRPLLTSNNTSTESQVPADRPYPVGLIKSISATNSRAPIPAAPEPVAFPTPAMKKQSYTVVQTGNPSKLLISTKPQPPTPEEEVPKKRQRKTRHLAKPEEPNKQPFSVTIEDAAPPTDPAFFTFINVDPLLQPSYVLPTDSIIQESQISTSTNVSKSNDDKDIKYTCNMCNEKFSREKKLLAHIHSHYNKMDEEDQMRAENAPKKRSRKRVNHID